MDTFYQTFIPKSGFYTIIKLWLQRIQKFLPQGHSWSARKSSPNTFSSARVAGRNSPFLLLLIFFYRGVSRLRVQKCTDFGFFEYYVAIYAIWTTGNVVALHGWWCPLSHWILIGHTWCGEEKPDLIASPGRGVREMFPQSLGFIPKECINEYHGNDSLGFSSRGWWETIPHLVITPSWLRPISSRDVMICVFLAFFLMKFFLDKMEW